MSIINDTLKKNGKWSRTSLTMFSAFWIGTGYAVYGLIKYGFDWAVFSTYMAVALGLKGIDVYDKLKTPDGTPKES